jgi:hypothetical protein
MKTLQLFLLVLISGVAFSASSRAGEFDTGDSYGPRGKHAVTEGAAVPAAAATTCRAGPVMRPRCRVRMGTLSRAVRRRRRIEASAGGECGLGAGCRRKG